MFKKGPEESVLQVPSGGENVSADRMDYARS